MFGLMMLGTGGVFFVGYMLPRRSALGKMFSMAGPLLWIAVSLSTSWGLKRLKERVIAPRGGYVAFRQSEGRHRTWIVALAALGAAVIAGTVTLFLDLNSRFANRFAGIELERLIGPGFALCFAFCYVVGGWRYRLPHMVWFSAFSLVLGAWVYRIDAGMQGLLWIMVGLGGAMAVTGAFRLRSFLQANPRIEDVP